MSLSYFMQTDVQNQQEMIQREGGGLESFSLTEVHYRIAGLPF